MTTNGPTVKVIFPAIPTILVAFRDPFRCDPLAALLLQFAIPLQQGQANDFLVVEPTPP